MFGASRLLRKCVPTTFNAMKAVKVPSFGQSVRTLATYDPSKVRNVAIIAHVDHGKFVMFISC